MIQNAISVNTLSRMVALLYDFFTKVREVVAFACLIEFCHHLFTRTCVKKVEFQYGVDVFWELGFDFWVHAV